MQVLVLVFAILMTLTLMTNGQWQAHIATQAMRASYNDYLIRRQEREFNLEQTRRYEGTKERSAAQPNGQKKERAASTPLNPRLSLSEALQAGPYREVIKRLFRTTYGLYPFYYQASEKFPNIEEQLLASIEQALEEKLEKGVQLAQLDLGNLGLQEVFYRMLKGTREPLLGQAGEGYPSLFSLLDVGRKKGRVSVYHAKPEVLLAVFQNADVVRDIQKMRLELYREAVKESADFNSLGQQFSRAFGQGRFVDEAVVPLDFTVNKEPPIDW